MQKLALLVPTFAVFVMIAAPAHGQRAQGRAPEPDPAPGPAPATETAPLFPSPPNASMAEAMQRRDEASIDIEMLLEQVSESTGMEFLVDPRVRARVFGVPQIENPTYPDLLSILRMHGYMAVEIQGRVNILPDANARHMPVRLLQRDDESVPDDEWVTRIITVPNAPQLVPILRPLMPQAAHLAATYQEENGAQVSKLVLVDTYVNVRRMTEIINTLSR
jgi:type II secretory pathway component GspD/PulD (secretin)